MRLRNFTRDVETGEPILTGSTQIVGPDGAPIATVGVNGVTGAWEYTANGLPGATSANFTGSGQTRKIAGDTSIQQGDVFTAEIPDALAFLSNGVYGETGLALSAPGGMQVRVGVGGGIVLGRFLNVYTPQDLAVGVAHATLGRIDSLVMRLNRTGTFAGRLALALVPGAAAAAPVPPTLTQNADTWEVKIGEVAVAAAAGAITSGNVSLTGRRYAGVPGRTLTGVRSFSGASEVILDEVFHAEWRDYEIVLNVDTLQPAASTQMQLRVARATTSDSYDWSYSGRSSSDVGVSSANRNVGSWRIHPAALGGTGVPAADVGVVLHLFDPMVARATRFVSSAFAQTAAASMEAVSGGGTLPKETLYDGMRLFPSLTSVLTGVVRVWAKG